MRCVRLCYAYRLGDVASGYFARHFNASEVCVRWSGSLACRLVVNGSGRGFCASLAPPSPPPRADELSVHLRLGDVLDWAVYRRARYNLPTASFSSLRIPASVRSATIYGNPSYRLSREGNARSLAHLRAVQAALARRNLSVAVVAQKKGDDEASAADRDFASLVFAPHVVVAHGNYAALVRRCRRELRLPDPLPVQKSASRANV